MRVAENLNAALHAVLAADPGAHLLGEDIADPYGGAFKVTRGLSERYPDRVLTTPISELSRSSVSNSSVSALSRAHTVSAASSVHPPRKADNAVRNACADSGSRA